MEGPVYFITLSLKLMRIYANRARTDKRGMKWKRGEQGDVNVRLAIW
jgi:hypothetical protein